VYGQDLPLIVANVCLALAPGTSDIISMTKNLVLSDHDDDRTT
jgi:hypothetical protein